MTPKEKAKSLVDKMHIQTDIIYVMSKRQAKQCALISVDEVQQLIKDLSSCKNRFIYIVEEMNYWNEVKQEINNL